MTGRALVGQRVVRDWDVLRGPEGLGGRTRQLRSGGSCDSACGSGGRGSAPDRGCHRDSSAGGGGNRAPDGPMPLNLQKDA